MKVNGLVVYSTGGNYRVLVDGQLYNAKPVGIFRKTNTKLIVGDLVELEINQNKPGLAELNSITKLFVRKNSFLRPHVSNIDNALIVTSVVDPELNDYLLDKMITLFQFKRVIPILVFSKIDLDYNQSIAEKIAEYQKYYPIFLTKFGFDQTDLVRIEQLTDGKITVATGQSGVGKSTLFKSLNPNSEFVIKTVSNKSHHGRHSTRHYEIFPLFPNAFFIDTPGFSIFSLEELTLTDIAQNFFCFESLFQNCKYNNCTHTFEKNCAIKAAVNNKTLSQTKYDNYLKLCKEKNNK